jgi:hypothetical protein
MTGEPDAGVVCPGCGRIVPESELQCAAPSRPAVEGALAVIGAAARSGLLSREAHHFLAVARIDLAAGGSA